MELNLENLKNSGSFVGAPVKKEISWSQGNEKFTATTYVKKFTFNSAIESIGAGLKNRQQVMAYRIASCICDSEGKAVFSYEDVTGESDPERGAINGDLAIALLTAINEVNNLGK